LTGSLNSECFRFITDHAEELTSYVMEKTILSWEMRVGLKGMEQYFAEKGTGDS